MTANAEPIVIVATKRTPIGQYLGYFVNTPAPMLASFAIKAVLKDLDLFVQDVDEVIMGCVLTAGLGQAPARQAAILADLPNAVGAVTINKMCGSGMKAIMLAHDSIIAGTNQIVVAGGMENMSCAPYLLQKARTGYRMGHNTVFDEMFLDGLEDAYEKGLLMGVFAERCAMEYGFSRKVQDDFAIESLTRAKTASSNGSFTAEIAPVTLMVKNESITYKQDELPLKAQIEKIPTLRSAFKDDGTVTAANSSGISDGAAVHVLMTASQANKRNLKPLAKIVGHATHSQDPAWFTTAPVGAIDKLLKKVNWTVSDVDLFEINEAFAVVTLAAMKDLNIPHNKVNIHGGACALGHPIGASGARIVTTLIYSLQQNGLKRGIAALCIGGGEATAIAIELM